MSLTLPVLANAVLGEQNSYSEAALIMLIYKNVEKFWEHKIQNAKYTNRHQTNFY